MARFWLADAIGRAVSDRFPWGTLAVNASGAFAIGLLAAVTLGQGVGGTAPWPLAVLAFLGSYTTVSSFSLQTLVLMHDRAWRGALANVTLSVGLCLSAAAAGLQAGGWFARMAA